MTAVFTDFVDATAGSATLKALVDSLNQVTAVGAAGSAHYRHIQVGTQVRFYKVWY